MKALLIVLFAFIVFTGRSQTLKEAFANKDTVLAAQLIKDGADPDEKDANGTTLLMTSCRFPDVYVAGFLLNNGASTDVRSPKGRTALMVACAYWSGKDIVKLLVEKGADVNAESEDGTTALMLAAQNEKLDVVDYLLEHRADAGKKNKEGKTALDFAMAGKVEEYMVTSIKDTRFDKEKVIESLQKAMEEK